MTVTEVWQEAWGLAPASSGNHLKASVIVLKTRYPPEEDSLRITGF